jgi:hypothetical protein
MLKLRQTAAALTAACAIAAFSFPASAGHFGGAHWAAWVTATSLAALVVAVGATIMATEALGSIPASLSTAAPTTTTTTMTTTTTVIAGGAMTGASADTKGNFRPRSTGFSGEPGFFVLHRTPIHDQSLFADPISHRRHRKIQTSEASIVPSNNARRRSLSSWFCGSKSKVTRTPVE